MKNIELKIVANNITPTGGDGQTANYDVECSLIGPSVPWNTGYGSYKTLKTSIAEIVLKLSITIDNGDAEIEWFGDGEFPLSGDSIDTSAIEDDIEDEIEALKRTLTVEE